MRQDIHEEWATTNTALEHLSSPVKIFMLTAVFLRNVQDTKIGICAELVCRLLNHVFSFEKSR